MKWEESKKEIKELGKKSKHSYRYDLVKRGGNSAVMGAKKTIAARFYQLKSGHALIAKYLLQIGKRTSAKVQIDYRLGYAHTRTRAGHSKLPVDPCARRSL